MDARVSRIKLIDAVDGPRRIVASYTATIGDFSIHRGSVHLNETGTLSVSTGQRGGISLPLRSATRKALTEAVLAALEDHINDRS